MEIAHKLMSGPPGLLDKDGAPKPSLQGGMGKSPLLFSPLPTNFHAALRLPS